MECWSCSMPGVFACCFGSCSRYGFQRERAQTCHRKQNASGRYQGQLRPIPQNTMIILWFPHALLTTWKLVWQ
jgi:hypothetical protein